MRSKQVALSLDNLLAEIKLFLKSVCNLGSHFLWVRSFSFPGSTPVCGGFENECRDVYFLSLSTREDSVYSTNFASLYLFFGLLYCKT